MNGNSTAKDWIPLLSSLITPIFIVLLIVWFHNDVADFLGIIKRAVGEQERSIKVGGWLEIGERARKTEINQMGLGDISVSLSEEDYEEWVIEKGSESLLNKLREKSREQGGKPVDVMVLKENIIYSPVVLERYISLLGVKYILFLQNNQFEYWIPAGLFMGQLLPRRTYAYDVLKDEIIGLRNETALPTSTANDVLALMQEKQTNYVAIVDMNGRYHYMVSKQDILGKLMSSMILQSKEGA